MQFVYKHAHVCGYKIEQPVNRNVDDVKHNFVAPQQIGDQTSILQAL